jgi:PBP1b-binding outer membrane lipoprotein LpoB
MKMINRLTSMTLLTALAVGLAGCMHAEDPVTKYVQRTDKVALGAGNAKDANAAIHMIDPWPRASADRRIPANGERMAGAHERYRNIDKQLLRPVILYPPDVQKSTGSAAASAK